MFSGFISCQHSTQNTLQAGMASLAVFPRSSAEQRTKIGLDVVWALFWCIVSSGIFCNRPWVLWRVPPPPTRGCTPPDDPPLRGGGNARSACRRCQSTWKPTALAPRQVFSINHATRLVGGECDGCCEWQDGSPDSWEPRRRPTFEAWRPNPQSSGCLPKNNPGTSFPTSCI